MDIFASKEMFDKISQTHQEIISSFNKQKKVILYPIAYEVLERY